MTRKFSKPGNSLAGSDVLKQSANVDGFGLNVFVVNGEVPVQWTYRTFFKNSAGLPTIVRYFVGGSRAEYKIQTVADSAGSLQGKYFTIQANNEDGDLTLYDIAYSSGATLTTPNVTITVPFVNGDTADTVAENTAIMLFSTIPTISVQDVGDTILVNNSRVGSRATPVDVDTGFTISNFINGTDGTLAAIRFQEYDTNMKVDMDEWVVYYDVLED